MYLRIIGDVHGNYDDYIAKAQEAKYSVQLGDLGFDYDCLQHLDPNNHRVLAGNHDNYSQMQSPHFLGDYGEYKIPKVSKIFFVRGGFSVDYKQRTLGKTWWKEEELSFIQMKEAFAYWQLSKSDIVLSHEGPESIINIAFGQGYRNGEPIRPSMTSRLLEEMLRFHKPKLWIFGHHHRSWNKIVDGTHFYCLKELETLDLNETPL